MALWARVNQLSQNMLNQIRLIYADIFPIEARHLLADWIEDHLLNAPMELPNVENVYNQEAAIFLNQLIAELERRASNLPENDVATRPRLIDLAYNMRYQRNPAQFYNNLLYCLDRERQYVANSEVFDKLQQLQDKVDVNESDNRNLTKDYEYLQHKLQQQQAYLDTMEYTEISMHAQKQHVQHQKEIHDCQQLLIDKRQALVDRFRKTVLSTNKVQNKVLDKYLLQWKIKHRTSGNGTSTMTDSELDTIQAWCESLTKIIWNTKDQLRLAISNHCMLHMEQEPLADPLSEVMSDLTVIQKKLIDNAFIIVKQPPRVIKTRRPFTATVRFLVGNTLNTNHVNPQVEVSIISVAQAKQTLQTNKASGQSCGVILNNIGNFKYNACTNQLSASFTSILLQNIKRSAKMKRKCVMDEMFALQFKTRFVVDHNDLVFSVWTISVPVVVIVHSRQEPQAWATITWDKLSAVSFEVLEKVPWNLMAEKLNEQFRNSTGRSLTAQNMHILCEKAFKTVLPFPAPNDMTITWWQFCKEAIPGHPFSFYEWFYAAKKVAKEHLCSPGMDGSIIGFIHKSTAEDNLLKCPPGTFLLRFSDSVLGGITIAWVYQSSQGQLQILHIQPFTAKDFSIRRLSERIHDIDDLLFLYPDTPKQEAFRRSVTPVVPPHNNYIRTDLRTVLIPISNNDQLNNFCSTASHNIQSPYTSYCDSLSVNNLQTIEPMMELEHLCELVDDYLESNQ